MIIYNFYNVSLPTLPSCFLIYFKFPNPPLCEQVYIHGNTKYVILRSISASLM